MARHRRKHVLNAALKALLEAAPAALKVPAKFISELAALPDDKQEIIAKLSQDQKCRMGFSPCCCLPYCEVTQ